MKAKKYKNKKLSNDLRLDVFDIMLNGIVFIWKAPEPSNTFRWEGFYHS